MKTSHRPHEHQSKHDASFISPWNFLYIHSENILEFIRSSLMNRFLPSLLPTILIIAALVLSPSHSRAQAKKSFVPDWVKDAIFYQIFPERFANGNPKNDPKGTVPWGDKPTTTNFFGGDLEGVLKNLDYIEGLGVNAIYFNPIFWSNSNHKYHTKDYKKIDPQFGDDKIFKKLLDECHARGIRVVLDFVPNHSGVDFFAFADIRKKGKKSKYLNWYTIKSFPVVVADPPNYEAWWGLKELPKLMVMDSAVKKYLFEATEKWTRMGIDGWRLDVPNEIQHEWWIEWRKLVKNINPECYITGEIWENATPWLKGDQFDAVMNYRFRNTVIHYFAIDSTTTSQFHNALAQIRSDYAIDVSFALQNLIDSHDTERYLTLCKGDKTKLMLTLFFQMTYLGAPMIYYGDEIGMTGERDPDCRKPFLWDSALWDTELLAYYKKLITLRKNYSPLRRGSFRALVTDDAQDVYVYSRVDADGEVICAINNGTKPANIQFYSSSKKMKDEMMGNIFETKNGKISVQKMPPKSVMMFVPNE